MFIVQMTFPGDVELLLKQECLKHNNDESLHSGESWIYLKGFVWKVWKVHNACSIFCLSLLSYRLLTFVKPYLLFCLGLSVWPSIFLPPPPRYMAWKVLILRKRQDNQANIHSPVHTSLLMSPNTSSTFLSDTPDIPRYIHVSHSTFFITLHLLVTLSVHMFYFFSFFFSVPLCLIETKFIILVDFEKTSSMINVAL